MKAGWLAGLLVVAVGCGSDAKPPPSTPVPSPILAADRWIVEHEISSGELTTDQERTCVRDLYRTFTSADLRTLVDPKANISDDLFARFKAGVDDCYNLG